MAFVFTIGLFVMMTMGSEATADPPLPFINYNYSTSLLENVSILWWNVNETSEEIVFELHIQTTGWIALGISPGGGMTGADIALGWIDQMGTVFMQDRYAAGYSRPIIDQTKANWIALQGREINGWTAIQFKRKFDTCDPPMDVPIYSGTNDLIFAYGLVDPDLSQPENDITYHEDRRGSRILSLRSYTAVPPASKFIGLDSFEFRLNNYLVPPNDTTYYCQVFKTPTNMPIKRHAIAYEVMVDPANVDVVHHLLMYECDSAASFTDTMLPQGPCDVIVTVTDSCLLNAAIGWAVGGDMISEYPEEAGYPFGVNFSVAYYLIQIHYNNPQGMSNRIDRSGIRFILGATLRQYDLAYLTFGTTPTESSLAIPPNVDQFNVDSYCPVQATMDIPESGITVFAALPHTHLQGKSVWTKLIRNGTPMKFLYNAESYDFNHQIGSQLPEPIKLYPGDAFYTRCVYSTTNKDVITLGGESTKQEMCLHFFAYYPRIPTLYTCLNVIAPQSWAAMLNDSSLLSSRSSLAQRLRQLQWSNRSRIQWQDFYNNAVRYAIYGRSSDVHYAMLTLPDSKDLAPVECATQTSMGVATTHQTTSFLVMIASLLVKLFLMRIPCNF